MKPRDLAAAATAVGVILIVTMAFLYDWRAGGAVIGVLLMAAGLLVIDVDGKPTLKEPPTQ